MNSIPVWSEGRGLVAAVALTSALLVPGLAVADDESQYALILDDEGS